jgi:Zn-finger nucleic acid-binding protein
MPEARVYQCPVCGAFAKDGERTCSHCSTLLATLRCGQCFELNFPGDLHCRGCGQELGLVLAAEASEQTCPDCKLPLQTFRAGAGELRACERCGGQMVTHGLLHALLEQREALGSALSSLSPAPRANPLHDAVRYRPCPSCQQLMNRKNFAGISGIVVDVCVQHGTFFDAGELPRVLSFVRHGGLAKAQAVLRNSAPLSAGLTGPGGLAPVAAAPTPGMLDDLVDLLAFVVDVLRNK